MVEGRLQPQTTLTEDIHNQVQSLVAELLRIRNLELIKIFGWLRIVFEFVVPLGLSAAAVIALAVRLS